MRSGGDGVVVGSSKASSRTGRRPLEVSVARSGEEGLDG